MKPRKVYIAGPMANIPEFNYPLFYMVEEHLNLAGMETVNPAELDKHDKALLEHSGNFEDGTGVKPSSRADFLRRDFHHMTECDGIILLPGWETSVGANCELLVAQISGMSTWLWDDGKMLEEWNIHANLNLILGHVNNVVWGTDG